MIATESAAGVRWGVDFADYLGWPCLSKSLINKAFRGDGTLSMLALKWHLDHPDVEETAAMVVGTALHMAVLEPPRFASECVVRPKFTGDGAYARRDAWEAEHEKHCIITEAQRGDVAAMAASIRAHPLAGKLASADGPCEASLRWTDPDTGVELKARVDKYVPRRIALDIKTCANAAPHAFRRAVLDHGYHRQVALYMDGLKETAGESLEIPIIAVENQPPYDVIVYTMEEESIALGRAEYKRALRAYAKALESGKWPGYPPLVRPTGVPDWYRKENEGD